MLNGNPVKSARLAKRTIVCFAVSTIVASAGYIIYSQFQILPQDNQAKSAIIEEKKIRNVMSEASAKRFRIKNATILKIVEEKYRDEVKDTLNREAMIAKLTSEVLDHRPDLVEAAKSSVFDGIPKILKLTQNVGGALFTQSFIVSDTRKCAETYQKNSSKKIKLKELFSDYCVDPLFDYSGGFSEDSLIDLTTSDIESRGAIEGLDNDFDKLVKVKLRGIVMKDFVARYESTGKLSYVD